MITNRYDSDNNTKALFELMRAGLWGIEALLSCYGEVDFAALMRRAEEQSVTGLITAGLEQVRDTKIPKERILQFIGATIQIEQRNRDMNRFLADLVERMRKYGIYTLVVKGQGVAQCYDKPLWRACGDIDFFLSDENYVKAKNYLLPLALSSEWESQNTMHLGMTIDGFVVELHGSLRSGFSSRADRVMNEIQKETFNGGNVRSWMNDKTQIFALTIENDILFVFTHFLKHFYKEGLGLRQICDWARMLWAYRDRLNCDVLEKKLHQMGLMSEWKAFGMYAVDYLGMPANAMPFYSDRSSWKKKAKKINEFVLNVGNMGHNRDTSYMKFPFVIRKFFSAGRRIGDLINHARIFPLDSLRFSFYIMKNGVKSAVRGEG